LKSECDIDLQYPFINCTLDSKPVRDLLLEYKAEVVEEELLDDEAEVKSIYFLFFPYQYINLSDFSSFEAFNVRN
jgi:STE20-like kinase